MVEPRQPDELRTIEAAFRNGSLTAISVLVGFSLSFMTRWAALPGAWERLDLAAVAAMTAGIALQVVAVALLLSVRSLKLARYNRAILVFLVGLAMVAAGVAITLAGDVAGARPQV